MSEKIRETLLGLILPARRCCNSGRRNAHRARQPLSARTP